MLSISEKQELIHVLLTIFPSQGALLEMMKYQFGKNSYQIPVDRSLQETVFRMVEWAETHGKTAELIRASQQWNPQNPALSKFLGTLSKSTQQDEQTVPASAPKISASLRQAFIDALLLVPGIEEFKVRSELSIGIPWQATISRGISVRLDLETMVDELGALGRLSSGAWPLVILADNAQAYAYGSAAEAKLAKVFKRLLTFYETNDKAKSMDS